jgi:hypothetical protein
VRFWGVGLVLIACSASRVTSSPPPPPVPPSVEALEPPAFETLEPLTFDETLPDDSFFAVDESTPPLAGALGRFSWFADGYLEEQNDGQQLARVFFWPTFAGTPELLYELPGYSRELEQAPDGKRLAYFARRSGEEEPTDDLYVWSKAEGPRLLLESTREQILGRGGLKWSPDGRWLAHVAPVRDSSAQHFQSCLLLIDARTGRVDYASPRELDLRFVDTSTGLLLIYSGAEDKPWWRLDLSTLTLDRGRPPAYTSPDGRFRVLGDAWHTRVVTTDGRRQYVVDRSLMGRALWVGPHELVLNAYWRFSRLVAQPDIVLDLETRTARRLWPKGYDEASVSPDLRSAVVTREADSSYERRWARRRSKVRL